MSLQKYLSETLLCISHKGSIYFRTIDNYQSHSTFFGHGVYQQGFSNSRWAFQQNSLQVRRAANHTGVPLGGSTQRCLKRSGCKKGSVTSSRREVITDSSPPIVCWLLTFSVSSVILSVRFITTSVLDVTCTQPLDGTVAVTTIYFVLEAIGYRSILCEK